MKTTKYFKLSNRIILIFYSISYLYSVYFTDGIYDYPRIFIISSIVIYFIILFVESKKYSWILLCLYILPLGLPFLIKIITYYNFLESPIMAGPTVDFAFLIVISSSLIEFFSNKYLNFISKFLFIYLILFLYRALFYFASVYNSSVILNEIIPILVVLCLVWIFTILKYLFEKTSIDFRFYSKFKIKKQIYISIATSFISILMIVNFYGLYEFNEKSIFVLIQFIVVDFVYILTVVSWIFIILKVYFNNVKIDA